MAEFEPSLFVTFVFNTPISIDGARRKLEEFHKRLDDKLAGRAALRRPERRSVYIATIEKPDTNLHIHALFKISELQRLRFYLTADEIWMKLAPAGNLDIKPVFYAEGAASYITKELRPETSERLLLPPHLGRSRPTIR
ncbi:hypothetical protein GCM10011515_03110 [Tsuneonella deserti]|uniref:Uncharacterized protein n=1 Tax=Tsuneonella deserti TaxID=2035528 RepID=A0ABQ1S087_9SPHN|nr:hypothetical protein [Tsuneonella deserti]GGD86999.1 hypothetical protein GCM10011515_03110 [Tsuneonella deserti]